jgi:hypothetical protein
VGSNPTPGTVPPRPTAREAGRLDVVTIEGRGLGAGAHHRLEELRTAS